MSKIQLNTQWESTDNQTVISFLQIPWNHSYYFSQVPVSKQFKYQMGAHVHSGSYKYKGTAENRYIGDTLELNNAAKKLCNTRTFISTSYK